jgi:hypothetical protein
MKFYIWVPSMSGIYQKLKDKNGCTWCTNYDCWCQQCTVTIDDTPNSWPLRSTNTVLTQVPVSHLGPVAKYPAMWDLRSSCMVRRVDRNLVTDVSGQPIISILEDQAVRLLDPWIWNLTGESRSPLHRSLSLKSHILEYSMVSLRRPPEYDGTVY